MTEQKEEKEMPFLGHIFELRGHLIRSLIAIAAGSLIVAVFWNYINDNFIMAPLKSDFITYRALNKLGQSIGIGNIYPEEFNYLKELKNLVPSGQIMSQIYTVLVCGLILSIPYIVWEIWKFISPGLTTNERKTTNGTVFGVSFFFLLGVLTSYFMLLPFSVQFLFTYDPFGVSNEWTLPSYTSLFVQTLLGMGLVFLFPVFAYFLAKMGILSPQFLRKYRRHALIVIFSIAAIITPADILSMFIAAIPLLVLYEISILITVYVFKKQIKQEKQEIRKT